MANPTVPQTTGPFSEIVERVARAVCVGMGGDPDARVTMWPPAVSKNGFYFAIPANAAFPMWQFYARAVEDGIKAMREPTTAMLNADGVADAWGDAIGKAEYCWQNMIDAALEH